MVITIAVALAPRPQALSRSALTKPSTDGDSTIRVTDDRLRLSERAATKTTACQYWTRHTDTFEAASMPNALQLRTDAVAVCERQHVERVCGRQHSVLLTRKVSECAAKDHLQTLPIINFSLLL
jgi:hypothetical protein